MFINQSFSQIGDGCIRTHFTRMLSNLPHFMSENLSQFEAPYRRFNNEYDQQRYQMDYYTHHGEYGNHSPEPYRDSYSIRNNHRYAGYNDPYKLQTNIHGSNTQRYYNLDNLRYPISNNAFRGSDGSDDNYSLEDYIPTPNNARTYRGGLIEIRNDYYSEERASEREDYRTSSGNREVEMRRNNYSPDQQTSQRQRNDDELKKLEKLLELGKIRSFSFIKELMPYYRRISGKKKQQRLKRRMYDRYLRRRSRYGVVRRDLIRMQQPRIDLELLKKKHFKTWWEIINKNIVGKGKDELKCFLCRKYICQLYGLGQKILQLKYCCFVCDTNFYHHRDLWRHQLHHFKSGTQQQSNFKGCDSCSKIKRELLSFTDNIFFCSICDQNFSRPSKYKSHLKQICNKQSSKKNKESTLPIQFEQGFDSHSTPTEKNHKCSNCPKTFFSRIALNRHCLIHTPSVCYIVCERCGAQFVSNYQLEYHKSSANCVKRDKEDEP